MANYLHTENGEKLQRKVDTVRKVHKPVQLLNGDGRYGDGL